MSYNPSLKQVLIVIFLKSFLFGSLYFLSADHL